MILIILFFLFHGLSFDINFNSTHNNTTIVPSLEFKTVIQKLKNISTKSACKFESFPVKSSYYEFKKPYHLPLCRPMFINEFVVFKYGVLNYKHNNGLYNCRYQCNFPNGEWEIQTSRWKEIKNAKPECDVFEVQCHDVLFKQTIFRDIFIQIYKIKKKPIEKITFLKDDYPVEKIKNKYNVHMIILDAISHYNLLRGLKNTKKYLEDEYSGIVFNRHNKVGSNSRPNGIGFLLNTRIQKLHDFTNLKESKPSDFEFKKTKDCEDPLDEYPHIARYYKQLNYTIYNGEDDLATVFTARECTGFRNPVSHHSLRAYTLKLYRKKYNNNKIYDVNHNLKCMRFVDYQFDHLIKFMKTYDDSRQFTITWITHLSHEHMTGHFEYDNYIKRFFQKNKTKFDKGFLIFMSDHGYRTGAFRYTKQGTFEDKNPFLIIAPPKDLRNNGSEVLKNLKINSINHTSHFDVYATMLDIATEGSKSNFKNMTHFNFTNIMKNDKIKGLSLLREIKQKRTCYEMEISSEYCLCRENFTKYDQLVIDKINNDKTIPFQSDVIVNTFKKIFISELNRQLIIGNITQYCVEMSENINGEFDLEYAYNNEEQIIFHLKIDVLPKGTFEGYFNEFGELVSNSINRIDRYSKYAETCLPTHNYRMFCYCRTNVMKPQKKKNSFDEFSDKIRILFKKSFEDLKNFLSKVFTKNF
uniref:Sulfatase domain-containing protein n=1 Tax=Parastrongyloides trichosuri TaxID=131310 RepID=A0A0N5A6L2_PARTI